VWTARCTSAGEGRGDRRRRVAGRRGIVDDDHPGLAEVEQHRADVLEPGADQHDQIAGDVPGARQQLVDQARHAERRRHQLAGRRQRPAAPGVGDRRRDPPALDQRRERGAILLGDAVGARPARQLGAQPAGLVARGQRAQQVAVGGGGGQPVPGVAEVGQRLGDRDQGLVSHGGVLLRWRRDATSAAARRR
jgi:hypothetical protein